jgi:hypothetical protein
VTYFRYARIISSHHAQDLAKFPLKKLLIVSIVLIVAGLGLILYEDPAITLASGGGGTTQFGSSGGLPPPTNSTSGGLPPGCKQLNGGVTCIVNGSTGNTDAEIVTLSGIALCGVGLCLSAVETISKPRSPYQTKTVT